MPNSFTQDGAAGATSGGVVPTATPPSSTMMDAAISDSFAGAPLSAGSGSGADSGSSQMLQNELSASARGAPIANGAPSYHPTAANPNPIQDQMQKDQAAFNINSMYPQNGFMRVAGGFFSQGGAIPDDTDGSPEQDDISKALESVDQVLAFGRKLHGLGGGDDEGAINTAANAYPKRLRPAEPPCCVHRP